MKLTNEYVTSGTNHISAANKYVHDNEFAFEFYCKVFNYLNTSNDSKFSLLFNAFQEQRYAVPLQNYKKSIHKIHSDSGGLQIMTVGKQMTPELYREIYERQARYSDIAMSFDEIPVKKLNEKSLINDFTSRKFDKDNFESFAKLSGKNLREQIEIFKDEKTKCKPLLIAHGNDIATYRQWIEIILKEVPASDHHLIGGISVSGAALGRGFLEDIQKAAFIVEFPLNHYVHLLGVGSIKRILPYLVFSQNGYYKNDLHLSYDSSSHSQGLTTGSFFIDGSDSGLGRVMNRKYEVIYEQIDESFGLASAGYNVKDLYACFRKREWGDFTDARGLYRIDDIRRNTTITLGFFGRSVYNFTKMINDCKKSKGLLLETAKKYKIDREISALYKINNLKDFEYWNKHYGHYIKSKKIQKSETETLRGLF